MLGQLGAQKAAKASGQGPAEDVEGGECVMLLSEAMRKPIGKRPEGCKSLRPGPRGGFRGRRVPNVAF